MSALALSVQFELRKIGFLLKNSIEDNNFPKILQIGKKSIQCPKDLYLLKELLCGSLQLLKNAKRMPKN